jgi:SAM-dependent methyltransferase
MPAEGLPSARDGISACAPKAQSPMHRHNLSIDTQRWSDTFCGGRDRRRRQIRSKLDALGLSRIPKTAAVLDLCCGACESLDALHELGFRDLAGMDIQPLDEVLADVRYDVVPGDVESPPFEPESKDWILILHALHHLEGPEKIGRVLDRAYDVLRPGGRLSIIDFPNTPLLQLAFRLFRVPPLLITPYLRYYGSLVQEEWPYLKDYLPKFRRVEARLKNGQFEIESERRGLFLFFLTLRKPSAAEVA